jgi:hypothetical protein
MHPTRALRPYRALRPPRRPSCKWRLLIEVPFQQPYRITSDGSRDCDEFDDIDTALPAFDFSHERLRLTELVSQVLLDDAGVLPRLPEQREEAGVIWGMKGLAHAPVGGEAPGKLILKPNYPKMGLSGPQST